MPIYTVEIDGKEYDIEGDRPPSEAEARGAVGAYQPQATPPPAGASHGMLAQSTAEGDPMEPKAFGRPLRPDMAMALNSEEVMGSPMAPPMAMLLGKLPGILARGVAAHPTLTSATVGAAPGILHGDIKEAAIGAALGTPFSRYVKRAATAFGGKAPRLSAPAKPPAMDMGKLTPPAPAGPPPMSSVGSLGDIAMEGARRRAPPVNALQREVMARDPINWRTTDAVPIDALKKRGIIEPGESQIGLGERIAALMKVGTPDAMAEATQLAKALRQRGHVRLERAQ